MSAPLPDRGRTLTLVVLLAVGVGVGAWGWHATSGDADRVQMIDATPEGAATAARADAAADSDGMKACSTNPPERFGQSQGDGPPGMIWIPGAEFEMGDSAGDGMPWERPVHAVRLDGFFMDAFEVTNAQFQAFVSATGHKTTAEKPADLQEIMRQLPPGTPPPPPEKLRPSSLVFRKTAGPVVLGQRGDWSQWWEYVTGADWRHPGGPAQNIEGKDYLPVVQVSWDDAVAYCKWAGRRLPTEAEWERAARGGLERKRFIWGDAPFDPRAPQANIWQGKFPYKNTLEDGFESAAPVGRFPPNSLGLHDMAGNVWEWCSDWYRADTYALAAAKGIAVNPQGPPSSLDPDEPQAPKRVIRGGSFLCTTTYCSSYRPSARMKTSPDSSSDHQGFRCAMSKAAWKHNQPRDAGAPRDR